MQQHQVREQHRCHGVRNELHRVPHLLDRQLRADLQWCLWDRLRDQLPRLHERLQPGILQPGHLRFQRQHRARLGRGDEPNPTERGHGCNLDLDPAWQLRLVASDR